MTMKIFISTASLEHIPRKPCTPRSSLRNKELVDCSKARIRGNGSADAVSSAAAATDATAAAEEGIEGSGKDKVIKLFARRF